MLRRLIELRPGPRQTFRVDDGGAGQLYLKSACDPMTVVTVLDRRQVEHLVITLADWLDGRI